MITGSLKVSRAILVAEVLLCFVPLTLMWVGAADAIAYFTSHAKHSELLATTGGTLTVTFLLYVTVLGVVGPLGLLAALRTIGTGWPAPRWLVNACIAVPLPAAPLMLLAYGITDVHYLASPDLWRCVVLLLLPVPAVLHLRRLGAWPGPASA